MNGLNNFDKTDSEYSLSPNQWRKSGWTSGGRRAHTEGLLGVGCREGVPFSTEKGSGERREDLCPPIKTNFSLEMARLVHSERYFLSVSLP